MESGNARSFFLSVASGLAAIIFFGLLWFFLVGPATPVGLGWYLFSFAAGLTMIVLPCTLPLAFVIVPLSMGRGAAKGFGIAIAFGLGVAITLSFYGVAAALIGEVAIGTLGAPLETVKNWLYFGAGAAAYLFALGELGLIRVRMPTYTGAAPGFIQRKQDYLKALFLGLFLGNIGVGCPHPATPIILTRIAASGDLFYGWTLFLVHAVGRILPLLLLALLGILGVNALSWLVARKDKVERATGWGMIFVAGFILVLGLFTHDWWVYSGQHTLFEDITREEQIVGVIAEKLGVLPAHTHGIPTGVGLFGLPLWLGNWALAGLWIIPFFWYHFRKKKEEGAVPPYRLPFFIALSLLLALTIIWVVPDRFLNHISRPGRAAHEEISRAPHLEGVHSSTRFHEEIEMREGLSVNLNVAPVSVRVGTSMRFDFLVNEKPGTRPVAISELELDHTKFMHVVGVRDDLNEFFHIHPVPTARSGFLSSVHIFEKPGRYKIWSEIKRGGVTHVFGHPEVAVTGEGAAARKEIFFGRSAIVGDYQVLLSYEDSIIKGKEADISFDIHDLFGREVAVEPFLAADMHLSIIKDDLKTFIHAHPEKIEDHHAHAPALIETAYAHEGTEEPAEGQDEKISFHIAFPEAGIYKLFAQFRPQGTVFAADDEALTAAFWIKVEEPVLLRVPQSVLVIISLIAIALLSLAVKKFLLVRE